MAIKSTKKSSRLGKVAKFFNPRSLRGGMALFGLVFALGGGGYYAYKSFAASLAVYPNQFTYSGGSYLGTDTNTSKGTISVAKIPYQSQILAKFYTNFRDPTWVTPCFTVRGQVNSMKMDPVLRLNINIDTAPTILEKDFLIEKGLIYKEVCYDRWVLVPASPHFINFKLRNTYTPNPSALYPYTPSDTYVSNVYIKYYD